MTVPGVVVFFALAGAQELLGHSVRMVSGRVPRVGAADPILGASVVLVPAEVWARPGVSVGQEDEPAVNRG
jgi:hypothetical protein